MQQTFMWLWIAFAALLAAAIVYGSVRRVHTLFWKAVICLTPVLLSGIIVGQATARYYAGEGGFKLGVDLVGGTILVYEVDETRNVDRPEQGQAIDPNQLAA